MAPLGPISPGGPLGPTSPVSPRQTELRERLTLFPCFVDTSALFTLQQ